MARRKRRNDYLRQLAAELGRAERNVPEIVLTPFAQPSLAEIDREWSRLLLEAS
jgi:hypothetical protein